MPAPADMDVAAVVDKGKLHTMSIRAEECMGAYAVHAHVKQFGRAAVLGS